MDQSDEARLKQISGELADCLVAVLPAWLERTALQRAAAGGVELSLSDRQRVEAAARSVAIDVEPQVREAVTADVDRSVTGPLAVLRDCVGPINELLGDLGAVPSRRDRVAVEMFPDDTYQLGPAAFADVDPSLQDPGVRWGAARAYVHRQRHGGNADPQGGNRFEQVLAAVAGVEGWMTDDQARRLYDRASELIAGERLVEIGSFRGRSMIVAATAAEPGVELVAIDPHGGGDRGPQEIAPDQERGDEDHAVFMDNLAQAGVADRVRHIRKMSDAAIDEVDGEVTLLYIDGAHRYGPARTDIVEWGGRVRAGGTMLIHDSFSSIGVTLALFTTTFTGGRWRYVGRSQSMAEFLRVDLGPSDRAVNLVRQAVQIPWFIRNLAVKALITMKLTPLTRLLAHRGSDWPY